jgi:uncharacterized surface protein with fasciclin (FAS1) repeats
LTCHLVAGEVKAQDVAKLSSAKTVEGGSVIIKAMDGGVMVDDARVTQADIMASNGVIHAIDTAMQPK